MHRISLTCGLSGGLIPYKYPAIYIKEKEEKGKIN